MPFMDGFELFFNLKQDISRIVTLTAMEAHFAGDIADNQIVSSTTINIFDLTNFKIGCSTDLTNNAGSCQIRVQIRIRRGVKLSVSWRLWATG